MPSHRHEQLESETTHNLGEDETYTQRGLLESIPASALANPVLQ